MNKYVNASEVLEFAIRIEKNGGQFYKDAVEMVSDEKIKKQLNSLATWEDGHIDTLHELFKNSTGNEFTLQFSPEEDSAAYIRTLADQHVFLKTANVESLIKSSNTTADILSLALRFEKDSVLFYKSLSEKVIDPDTKTKIQAILAEEESHVEQILRILTESGISV